MILSSAGEFRGNLHSKKSHEKWLLIQTLGKEKSCLFPSVRYSHLAFWQKGTIFFLGCKTIYQKDPRLVYAGKIPSNDWWYN